MSTNNFFTSKGDYAVSSLIIGILAVVLFPLLVMFPLLLIVLGVLAIILGSVSLRGNRRSLAITGIVLGGVMTLYAVFLLLESVILSIK